VMAWRLSPLARQRPSDRLGEGFGRVRRIKCEPKLGSGRMGSNIAGLL